MNKGGGQVWVVCGLRLLLLLVVVGLWPPSRAAN